MFGRSAIWGFAASFWGVFGFVSGVQVWLSMISHGHYVPLLLGYHVLVWEGWLLPTMAILALAKRWPVVPPRWMSVLMHLLLFLVIAVLHNIWWMFLLIVLKPYDRMNAEVAELRLGQLLWSRLPMEWTIYLVVLGAAIAVDYYERYRERSIQAAKLETSLSEARLHALELQIQPHFLFNTMNAISSLVRNRRNDEAVTMLAGLSELLRYTLDHAGHHRVPLEKELAVLRRYLEIQHMRFPDRMSFSIDVSDDAARAAVPALLLQPLAENAVRHGIDASASAGVVNVRAFRSGARLQVEIFNSGRLAEAARTGIGLKNTRERLQHLYGDAAAFDLANTKDGVLASLSIPWSEAA